MAASMGPCSSCGYWVNNPQMKRMECHRYPPFVPSSTPVAMWPAVKGSDVCGDWTSKALVAMAASDPDAEAEAARLYPDAG